MSAEKREQGQHKPRKQGVHILPGSPDSSTLEHWLAEQVESCLCRLRGGRSVFQQLLVAECSLGHRRILGYAPQLKRGYHRDTHKSFVVPSLHCICLCPSSLTLLKDFVFLLPHDKLSLPIPPNCQTPFSGLELREEHQLFPDLPVFENKTSVSSNFRVIKF